MILVHCEQDKIRLILFLHLLKETNNTKIKFVLKEASELMEDGDRKYEDTLKAMGANAINLSIQIKQGQQIQTIYPYAIINYKNNISLVSLYTGNKRVLSQSEINSAEAMLEYQFTKAIDDITKSEKPLVAYSYANGELTDARTYDLLQAIQPQYNLFTFNINARPAIPDTFKVLMIVKPSLQFTEDEKLKIDQEKLFKNGFIERLDLFFTNNSSDDVNYSGSLDSISNQLKNLDFSSLNDGLLILWIIFGSFSAFSTIYIQNLSLLFNQFTN